MKLMAGLIRRGREAREVMAVLDRAFAGVQRNDPCPCGSGRKFKQCHGRPQAGPGSGHCPHRSRDPLSTRQVTACVTGRN